LNYGPVMQTDDLRFKVVAVANCGEELLGSAADPLLAHVLLGAAAAMYPRRKIELRFGARIVEPRATEIGSHPLKPANLGGKPLIA